MKKHVISLVVLAMVFPICGIALGESDKAVEVNRPQPERMGQHQRVIKDLGLSEEQAKQFRQIMQTHRQAMKIFRDENKGKMQDLRKQMRAARESGDEKLMESTRAKMKDHFEAAKKHHEDLEKRLEDVLNKEQMDKFREAVKCMRKQHRPSGPMSLGALRAARMTEEQKAKAKKIIDQAIKKIIDEVLTDEQRERIKKQKPKKPEARS